MSIGLILLHAIGIFFIAAVSYLLGYTTGYQDNIDYSDKRIK